MKILIYAIGVSLFFEGVPYLLFPSKAKEMMQVILNMPNGFLRALGGLLVVFGFALLYFL